MVLRGRVAVITGASRGIGAAVARAFAAEGATLLLVARGAAALDAVAAELGGRALAADVTDEAEVARVAAAAHELGGADVVVHAAGAFELAPLTRTPVESFDRVLAVNLRAAFLLVRALVPGMVERGRGRFVSIGSVAGRRALPHNGAYSASKFGLRGLHAVLDTELRGSGVSATLVEPAATDTPLWDAIDPSATPGLPPRTAMLHADAVADAVLYAVSRPQDAAVHNIILDRN